MVDVNNIDVQRLLDQAATLIQDSADGKDTDEQAHREWLRAYHEEKARFGQPAGSPAYTEQDAASSGRTKTPRKSKA
jgi:hypothetical protein